MVFSLTASLRDSRDQAVHVGVVLLLEQLDLVPELCLGLRCCFSFGAAKLPFVELVGERRIIIGDYSLQLEWYQLVALGRLLVHFC